MRVYIFIYFQTGNFMKKVYLRASNKKVTKLQIKSYTN